MSKGLHKVFVPYSSCPLRYVPLPKGEVHKKKEVVQDVTLHDLDVANAKPQVLSSPKL